MSFASDIGSSLGRAPDAAVVQGSCCGGDKCKGRGTNVKELNFYSSSNLDVRSCGVRMGVGWGGWGWGRGGALLRKQNVADHPHPPACPLQGYSPELFDGKLVRGQLKHLFYYE